MIKQVHAVGILFEDESGEVLVLKRHSSSPEPNTWGLVGGKIDEGEDKITAAIREASEETGHVVPRAELQYLRTYNWHRTDSTIMFEVFKYKVNKIDINVHLESNKSTDYKWAMPQDLYPTQDLMVGLYPILKDSYYI